ncbi:MAG: alkaline phosphatase family protein [Gammaproteobacteria bacterium]|jgi:predicted AlkP superfamily pyrophosphatase or phosphodiesterase
MSRIAHKLSVTKPDYTGGSIVNLMRSVGDWCGAPPSSYAPVPGLSERLAAAQRIVLLVIDGLGTEVLQAQGAGSVFDRARARDLTSVYPPTTASAVTTLLSGQAPRQHGLTGWFMHFRQLGAVAAVLPFVPRYGRATLTDAGASIESVVDCASFFGTLPCASQTLMPAPICDSDFSRRLGGPATRLPYHSLDEFATTLGDICRGKTEAAFTYAYWSEFDHLCHVHGPSAAEPARHIAELDRALAPVFDACAAHGTVLLAVADHGFIDSGPAERIELARHPELARMLTLPLCGEPRTAYCYVRAACVRDFECYVAAELSDFARAVPSEQLVEEGWFGPGISHPELAARIGDYTLQMLDRYTLTDRVAGERDMQLNGVHGGTSAAEMIVPLMIAGP